MLLWSWQMDRRCSYRCRKRKVLLELIFSVVFLFFLGYWLKMTASLFGAWKDEIPIKFSISFFSIIPFVVLIFVIWFLLRSLGWLLLPWNLVEEDKHYLYLRPSPWRKIVLAWDSVERFRYEQSFSSYSQQSRVYSRFYVYIKAQGHKTVKFNIGDMDGEIDDLVAELKAFQPNIAIRGLSWEKRIKSLAFAGDFCYDSKCRSNGKYSSQMNRGAVALGLLLRVEIWERKKTKRRHYSWQ